MNTDNSEIFHHFHGHADGLGKNLEIELELLIQATRDREFRSRFIAEPKAVFASKGLNFVCCRDAIYRVSTFKYSLQII
jgi:hypothetical protein